jgi:Ser/Thr protein kinase RdoA (MazF antagonist)
MTQTPQQTRPAASEAVGSPTPSSVPETSGKLREQFAADELAIVLSYFDIGTIETIKEFPRGSRKAPKLLLRTDRGMYLLKRRAKGKDDPFKVAFCHHLQLYLASKQFPLPHLIGTKKDNNSMLQWRGAIYELFEYIKGTAYDNSLEATADSGKILALFHKLLADFEPDYDPPQGSYHASRHIAASMDHIPHTLMRVEPSNAGQEDRIRQVVQFLHAAYNAAAMRVNEMGMTEWPMQIVHSDWHPGNMLFRGPRVVAVIDYDAARIQQRIIDVANGSLQFSILGGGDDPAQWPEYLDESRFKRFLRGYDSVPGCVLSRAELCTVPWLMIEALIAESIIPIAATGSFARMEGVGFLLMVERKVRWLQEHGERLAAVLEE